MLDEIGEMPLPMQAKLLRVLETKHVVRLSGRKEIPLDVRVISATNIDLVAAIAAGRFRTDLYFRLGSIHVTLPPLRERSEDIPLLVEHFLHLASTRSAKALRRVSAKVLEELSTNYWPGNVRQLGHVLQAEVELAPPEQTELTKMPRMLERYAELQKNRKKTAAQLDRDAARNNSSSRR